MNRYENKVALVTGAGSGIGKAIARRLASEGAHVIIFENNKENGENVVSEICQEGGKAEMRQVDVASYEEVGEAVKEFPSIDVLVNNAGVSSVGTVENTGPEELDRIYSINVKGLYNCMHWVVPTMKQKKYGVILNLASIASKVGLVDRFAYSMSKGAVLTMTLSVARDFVKDGIRCNCICPSRVYTPFVENYLEKNYNSQKEEAFKNLNEYQPIGRMGKPEEISNLVAFLCSDEASFITGSAYDIDGGVTRLR